jgi:hypothetical protein
MKNENLKTPAPPLSLSLTLSLTLYLTLYFVLKRNEGGWSRGEKEGAKDAI